MTRRLLSFYVALFLLQRALALWANAGTTGAIVGRVLDATTKAPVAGARVNIASPSQQAATVTDASGQYRFLSLAPDTYVLTVEREGYDPASIAGVTVLADQTQNVAVSATRTLRTIGRVTSRSASDLVKPGTTSDVYSVNAAGAAAAQALGGPGGLNTAYSAIASVPGTVVQQGQQGWFQTVNIRGGDIDQVGYELDGIPANRVYDNAPQTTLSSLGQQELQVYTGGVPASSDASSISGYVNQVIKSGTYPGFLTSEVGLGGPAFYHKLSVEVGGATRNRLFSYYAGFAGVNQDFRYVDQYNGVSDPRLFYPIAFPGRFNLYDGSTNSDGTPGTIELAPGATYSIANTTDRENVVNLHFGIPHKRDTARDDVQLLYLTSQVVSDYYSSINDQGGPANVVNAVGNNGRAFYHDGYVYDGPLFAPPSFAAIKPYYFPNSSRGRAFNSNFSNDARDYSDNGVAITKVQYQRNFDPKSYLRLFGYTEYSNWFIGGPGESTVHQQLRCRDQRLRVTEPHVRLQRELLEPTLRQEFTLDHRLLHRLASAAPLLLRLPGEYGHLVRLPRFEPGGSRRLVLRSRNRAANELLRQRARHVSDHTARRAARSRLHVSDRQRQRHDAVGRACDGDVARHG